MAPIGWWSDSRLKRRRQCASGNFNGRKAARAAPDGPPRASPGPRDPIALTKLIGDIATGQVVDAVEDGKNAAAAR